MENFTGKKCISEVATSISIPKQEARIETWNYTSYTIRINRDGNAFFAFVYISAEKFQSIMTGEKGLNFVFWR